MLYDADRIETSANEADSEALYRAQQNIFLDPHDPAVAAAARAEKIPEAWINAAKNSPVWKMAMDWKIAFPLHPEYRTLPMVWYIPPLSPIQNAAELGSIGFDGDIPDVHSLRIPLKYLANLLTAGDERPIISALERMLAMRAYMRAKSVEGVNNAALAERFGMTAQMIEEMYQIMAIANYEDRFVIPSSHREQVEHAMDIRSGCGFTDGNGCSNGISPGSIFGGKKSSKRRFPSEAS
jgi:nitrate reductase beta subunit